MLNTTLIELEEVGFKPRYFVHSQEEKHNNNPDLIEYKDKGIIIQADFYSNERCDISYARDIYGGQLEEDKLLHLVAKHNLWIKPKSPKEKERINLRGLIEILIHPVFQKQKKLLIRAEEN